MSATQRRGVTVLLAALAVAACAHAGELGTGGVAARISDPELREASGLAASSRDPALLWVHDDSGNPPRLHAIDTDGRPRGTVLLEGVPDRDWEDMDAFEWRGEPWLLVADVGDNAAEQAEVLLHVLPEPDPNTLAQNHPLRVKPAWTIALRYPGGPADCEAVAVDPVEERVYLLTKRLVPPLLLSVPLQPPQGEPATARLEARLDAFPQKHVGALALPIPTGRYRNHPTGMSFSRDGRAAAVLTYGEVYLFRRRPGETWATALSRVPEALGAPDLPQAEAITFSRDGTVLYVTGEGREQPLLRYEVKPGEVGF